MLRVLAVATEGAAGVFQNIKQWAAQADVEFESVPELPLAVRQLAAARWDIVLAVLGGVAAPAGPLVGAFIVTLLSELLNAYAPAIHLTILGVLLVVVALRLPTGLLGAAKAASGYYLRK